MAEDTKISSECMKIYSSVEINKHHIYLSNSIENESLEYFELLKLLNEAHPTDQLYLHLANFGGACHTGMMLAHAIRNCAATAIVIVEAPCYSMGAIIALSGLALVMRPGTFLMFHNYSTVESGKGGEVKAAVTEYSRHFVASIKYFCTPFLTTKEIKTLQKDEDIYIHADDPTLPNRLTRHFKSMRLE